MSNRDLSLLACFAALALSACGGGGGDNNPPADSGPGDSGVVIHDDASEPDTGRRDIGPRDVGPRDTGIRDAMTTGDNNDSPAEAVEVTVGSGAGVSAAIDRPQDHDYYKFTAAQGAWVLISGAAVMTGTMNRADTVITLYDEAAMKLAENDDALIFAPNFATDSEIAYHIPADGTYIIEVREWSDWVDMAPNIMPEGGSDYTYRISVLLLNDATNGVVIDPERGNDAASAVNVEFGRNSSFVLGTWTSTTDVDVYRMTFTGAGVQRFDGNILPFGPDGQGSTSPAGPVWLTDAAGTTIIARIDNSIGIDRIAMPMVAGTYLIWIGHTPMPPGTNDFYDFKPDFNTENPPETGDPMNDTLAGAETLTQEMIDETERAGFVLLKLPTGDVDYLSFTVQGTEQISAVCSSMFGGAGIRDLTIDVRDAADVLLASATEMPGMSAFVQNVTVTSTGTYYLRVSRGAQDPEVTGDWSRCAVRTTTP